MLWISAYTKNHSRAPRDVDDVDRVLGYMRYINLDSRTDRKTHIEKSLRRFYPKAKPLRLPAIRRENGALGCTLSHLKVFDEALSDPFMPEYVCVFEDDAMFTDPSATMGNLRNCLSKNYHWDVILLGCSFRESKPVDPDIPEIHRVSKAHAAHAYIVRRSFLPVIRDCFRESARMIEQTDAKMGGRWAHDQNWIKLMNDHVFLTFVPILVTQLPNHSDIVKSHTDYSHMMTARRPMVARSAKDTYIPPFHRLNMINESAYIAYINLDRDEGRKESIERHFADLGISINRWAAAYGRNVSMIGPDGGTLKDRTSPKMTDGEIGCTFSHISCMLRAPKSQPFVLIMEDDARFRQRDIDLVRLFEVAPSDAEVIQIAINPGKHTRNVESSHRKGKPFVAWKEGYFGTIAYVVKTSALSKLDDYVQMSADNEMKILHAFNSYRADDLIYKIFKTYVITFPLAYYADDVTSTIHPEHDAVNDQVKSRVLSIGPPCEPIKSCIQGFIGTYPGN